jgi:hypothetical protein
MRARAIQLSGVLLGFILMPSLVCHEHKTRLQMLEQRILCAVALDAKLLDCTPRFHHRYWHGDITAGTIT